jgi:hypothetical protein
MGSSSGAFSHDCSNSNVMSVNQTWQQQQQGRQMASRNKTEYNAYQALFACSLLQGIYTGSHAKRCRLWLCFCTCHRNVGKSELHAAHFKR